MRRRTFLAGAAATAAAAAGGAAFWARHQSDVVATNRNTRTYGSTTITRQAAVAGAPNVLFIALDDCNDWLGYLNPHPGTKTPNIDALAARSLSFSQAYCTAPMCLPARTGVVFGRQPFEVGVYDHGEPSRANATRELEEGSSCLVDDFWAAGYETYAAGKVYHESLKPRWSGGYHTTKFWLDATDRRKPDVPQDRFDPAWLSPYDGKPEGKGERFTNRMIDFGPSGRTEQTEPDGESATWVGSVFKKQRSGPFFVGYGVTATHLPWRIPQAYFDMHPLDQVVVPEVRPDDLDDLGPYARDEIIDTFHAFEYLKQSGLWERAVQAYQAAISYADAEVGRVLDELDASGYADDTIVVLWSDHGFHIGEKMHIHKFTLWERATHVPFLVHVPGRFDGGQVVDRPVSCLDMGPTLVDLCDAQIRIHSPHSGRSLLPVVADPAKADERPPIMTWEEGNHAVRRGPWRYIRYRTGEAELYDHRDDPDEFTNLVHDPGHASVIAELDRFLPVAASEQGGPAGTADAGEAGGD